MGILSKERVFCDTVNMDERFYIVCLTFLTGDKSLAAKVEYSRSRSNSWYLLLIATKLRWAGKPSHIHVNGKEVKVVWLKLDVKMENHATVSTCTALIRNVYSVAK